MTFVASKVLQISNLVMIAWYSASLLVAENANIKAYLFVYPLETLQNHH